MDPDDNGVSQDPNINDPGTGNQPNVIDPNTPVEDPFAGLSGAGRSYLERLPEDQHQTVIPHVKNWDRHVQDWMNQQKQQIEQVITPYKQFGDPDQVSRAIRLAQWAENDPNGFVKALQEAGLYKPDNFQAPPSQPQIPEELAPILSKYDAKLSELDQLKAALPQITSWVQQQQQKEQQQQLEQNVQSQLAEAKKTSKYYDENGVLAMMASGAFTDPLAAAKAWDGIVQARINDALKQSGQAPPVLGSQGAPPVNNGTPPSQMSDKQVVDYAANYLAKMMTS